MNIKLICRHYYRNFMFIYSGIADSVCSETRQREKTGTNHTKTRLAANSLFIHCLLLLFCCKLLRPDFFYFFPPESFPSITLLIIIPIGVLLSVSFVIQLSHFVYEGRRKIVWDKAQNLLIITEKHKEFELDLKSDDLKIVEFIPILTYGFPGNDFPVLVVYDNKNHVKISGMIYTNYDFYSDLTRHKNYSTIKQQFNILY